MNEETEVLVDWRPDLEPGWTAEDQAEVERLEEEMRRCRPIVRRLRSRLGLSQQQAARILGTTQSNVSKIDAKVDPRISVLRRLVESQGGTLEIRAALPGGRTITLMPWERPGQGNQ